MPKLNILSAFYWRASF